MLKKKKKNTCDTDITKPYTTETQNIKKKNVKED